MAIMFIPLQNNRQQPAPDILEPIKELRKRAKKNFNAENQGYYDKSRINIEKPEELYLL